MQKCTGTGFPGGEGEKINLWLQNPEEQFPSSQTSNIAKGRPPLPLGVRSQWIRTDAVPRGCQKETELIIPSFSDHEYYFTVYLQPPGPHFQKVWRRLTQL